MSNEPAAKFRESPLEVSVWENEGENGKWYSVKVERSYKDKNDEWQKTTSINSKHISILKDLLTQAAEKIEELEKEN